MKIYYVGKMTHLKTSYILRDEKTNHLHFHVQVSGHITFHLFCLFLQLSYRMCNMCLNEIHYIKKS